MQNILIVEDESLVALELSATLEEFGFEVVGCASSVKMAKEYFAQYQVDILLMDINLGDTIDGISLYESLACSTPLIYLTAYKDEETISRAIATEPIGYLVKPIDPNELMAMLKLATFKINKHITCQNRDVTDSTKMIYIGEGYSFDMDDHKLFFQGHNIVLSDSEVKLLVLLLEADGKVVSFKSIEDEIWPDKSVSNAAMRTLIYRLRSKFEHKFIQNEFKFGLRLSPTE